MRYCFGDPSISGVLTAFNNKYCVIVLYIASKRTLMSSNYSRNCCYFDFTLTGRLSIEEYILYITFQIIIELNLKCLYMLLDYCSMDATDAMIGKATRN